VRQIPRLALVLLAVSACTVAIAARTGRPDPDKKPPKEVKKPNLFVRANPAVSFSPARIVVRAEVRGGPNDYEDFYCAGVEWDWGDGTKSENAYDCEPYEAGKSEIRRNFTSEHVFQTSGSYRVQFSLKQRDRIIAATNTQVQVRPGLRDGLPP
jgi:hypothetical protein